MYFRLAPEVVALMSSVPLLLTNALLAKEVAPDKAAVAPASMKIEPVVDTLPLSVTTPGPLNLRLPVPEMSLLTVKASLRLNLSVPVSAIGPATLPLKPVVAPASPSTTVAEFDIVVVPV